MKYMSNHFKLKYKTMQLNKKIVQLYIDLKKKDKKSDVEKQDLKRLRQIIKQQVYFLQVSLKDQVAEGQFQHKPTRDDIKKLLSEVREKYRKQKQAKNKVPPPQVQEYYGVRLERYGGVYLTPGTFLNADKNNRKNSPDQDKKPRLNANYIGIELEFNNQSDTYREQKVIKEYLVEHKLGKYTKLTTDGSCGHELRVLLEEKEYQEPLKNIMDGLVSLGYSCDDRCGTHVHIDMRQRDVKRAYRNLVAVQDVMYKLVTKKRRTNNYCRKNQFMTYDEATARSGDRYLYVNHTAYSRHKTLEVRLHHGTLSFDELNQWLKLLIKVVNYDGEIDKPITKLIEFSKVLKMSKDEVVELRKRYKTYNSRLTTIGA
jgi:hypothetical protein